MAHTELKLGLMLDEDLEGVLNLEHLVFDSLRHHGGHHLQVTMHSCGRAKVFILQRQLQLQGFLLMTIGLDACMLNSNDIFLGLHDRLGAGLLFTRKEPHCAGQLRLEVLHTLLTVGVINVDAH